MKRKTANMLSACACLLVLLAATSHVDSQDDFDAEKFRRRHLNGLTGLKIVVERINPLFVEQGFTPELVTDVMQSTLTSTGFKVLSEKQRLKTPGTPYIYFYIEGAPKRNQDGEITMYFYNYYIEVREAAALTRTQKPCFATTYKTGSVGFVGARADLKQTLSASLESLLTTFVADWTAANFEQK